MIVMCGLISLDKVGEGIRGKIEWSGIVATIPSNYRLLGCLVVSDVLLHFVLSTLF